MTPANDWSAPLRDWRSRDALPLWAGAGIDPATGTSWEALDHTGVPLKDINRRQRVQFRQATVFARSDDAAIRAVGWQMHRHTMDHGFDPDTGYLATWVTPDLRHLDQTHDLYDLAFALLAAASLGHAGYDVAADIAQLTRALEVLRAPLGWHETATQRQPRRQNPHMHLFEAATVLYALTRSPAHLAIAQSCLDVITTYALRGDGTLLEFFSADWTPLSGTDQAEEPGHLAEWIYLADRFATISGIETGMPLVQMWESVLAHRLASGFLPDVVGVTTRRLWPQTELLKAACVMQTRGHELSDDTTPAHIARHLWATYMNTPVAGGWYDSFNEPKGDLRSTNMPASTFYHIDLAVEACSAL